MWLCSSVSSVFVVSSYYLFTVHPFQQNKIRTATISVTSLRRGPPLPSKPESGLLIIDRGSSCVTYTSPHCTPPYLHIHVHKATLTHDTRAPGGAAAAAAAARAGGRIRTGRSSDRLGGRCSVCQSAPSQAAEHVRTSAYDAQGVGAERRARRAERAPKKILRVVGLLDAISIKSLTHTLGTNRPTHRPNLEWRRSAPTHAAARSARVLQRRAPRVSLYLASALRACVSS